jgi:hypothetical protein
MGKQLVNFITCGCESSASFFVLLFHYYIFQAFINTLGFKYTKFKLIEGTRWLNELGSWIILIQAYHQYGVGSCPAL